MGVIIGVVSKREASDVSEIVGVFAE